MLTSQVKQKRALIDGYTNDLSKLVVKGTETQAARHSELNQTAQRLASKIQQFAAQRRMFITMHDEVKSMRAAKAPAMLRETQARYTGSGLSAEHWDDFLLIYKGDVDKALMSYGEWADGKLRRSMVIPRHSAIQVFR